MKQNKHSSDCSMIQPAHQPVWFSLFVICPCYSSQQGPGKGGKHGRFSTMVLPRDTGNKLALSGLPFTYDLVMTAPLLQCSPPQPGNLVFTADGKLLIAGESWP